MLTAEQEIIKAFQSDIVIDVLLLKETLGKGLIEAIERLSEAGQITPEYVENLDNYFADRRLSALYMPYKGQDAVDLAEKIKAEIISESIQPSKSLTDGSCLAGIKESI